MAPSSSYARELAVAASKRPYSLTRSESLSSAEDSASDFGAPYKTPKKPVKKKAKTTRASVVTPKDDMLAKVPKEFQSKEGHALLGNKWWKEMVKTDEFWAALMKHTPKTVLQKRLKVEIAMSLNGDDKKDALSSRMATAQSVAKPVKAAAGKKTTSCKSEDIAMADPDSDTEIVDSNMASPPASIIAERSVQTFPQAASGLNSQHNSQTIPVEARNDSEDLQGGGDLFSRAIADSNISPGLRAHYITLREDQKRIAKDIEAENEKRRLNEENKQERVSKKEQSAVENGEIAAEGLAGGDNSTNTAGEDSENVASIIEAGSGQIDGKSSEDAVEPEHLNNKDKKETEKPRKSFNPTNF